MERNRPRGGAQGREMGTQGMPNARSPPRLAWRPSGRLYSLPAPLSRLLARRATERVNKRGNQGCLHGVAVRGSRQTGLIRFRGNSAPLLSAVRRLGKGGIPLAVPLCGQGACWRGWVGAAAGESLSSLLSHGQTSPSLHSPVLQPSTFQPQNLPQPWLPKLPASPRRPRRARSRPRSPVSRSPRVSGIGGLAGARGAGERRERVASRSSFSYTRLSPSAPFSHAQALTSTSGELRAALRPCAAV